MTLNVIEVMLAYILYFEWDANFSIIVLLWKNWKYLVSTEFSKSKVGSFLIIITAFKRGNLFAWWEILIRKKFVLKMHYQGIWLKIHPMIFSLNFKHYCMNLRCSQPSKIVMFSVIVFSNIWIFFEWLFLYECLCLVFYKNMINLVFIIL